HVKDPSRFHLWDETARQGFAALSDGGRAGGRAAERYRVFNEGMARLLERGRVHALEAADLLTRLAGRASEAGVHEGGFNPASRPRPGVFCGDTFRFLAELGRNNRRDWMDQQRDRYRFAVRGPLVELCRA